MLSIFDSSIVQAQTNDLFVVENTAFKIGRRRHTEARRANGATDSLAGPYDGYAECVRTTFDEDCVTVTELMGYFFEIIDPYSVNRQGADVGEKYRTGVYSEDPSHLREAEAYIRARPDCDRIRVEVLPLARYVPSAEEHQNHLDKFPDDYCHIPRELMTKYLLE